MRDRLGSYLARQRNHKAWPHVRGRLLDVGCGLNTFVRGYAGPGCGVDVYQWGDVDVVVADTSKLGFQDGEFGTVSFLACLNHIPNRADVLREAFRVLEPDGRVVVTMIPPTRSRVWHFLRAPWDHDQSERGMVEGEVFGLAPREVRRLLTAAGFQVVREERFMLGINRLTVAVKPGTR